MGLKKTTQKYDNTPPVRQEIADALFTATQQKVLTLLLASQSEVSMPPKLLRSREQDPVQYSGN
jgi:hypothetical protein